MTGGGNGVAVAALEAHLVVRHHGCIVSECLTDGAHAAQVTADRHGDVLVMNAPTADQVDVFLRNVQATQREPIRVMSRTPLSVVLRGRNPEGGVTATIYASGCSVLWPSVWTEGLERYTVVASSRARLDALLEALAQIGDVRVERISEVAASQLAVNVPLADLTERLTQRQLTALRMAIQGGYYDAPRRTSTQAMAAAVGVSRSTFEEHLRKAEQRVLDRLGAAISAHPALVDGARGRVGRPSAATTIATRPR